MVALKRTRERRLTTFTEQVYEISGLVEDDLAEAIVSQPIVGDIFEAAAHQSLRSGDPVFQDMLAKLVAAALSGTKYDTISYLIGRLEKLSVPQVRVLYFLSSYKSLAQVIDAQVTEQLASDAGMDVVITAEIIRELITSGFVVAPVKRKKAGVPNSPRWVTRWRT